jgi:hypothetical protein
MNADDARLWDAEHEYDLDDNEASADGGDGVRGTDLDGLSRLE